MHISKVSYKANAPRNGHYQHQHIEAEVSLNADDDPKVALEGAKRLVHEALGIDVTEDQVAAAEETIAKARRAGLR
jgi:hypothetical protein